MRDEVQENNARVEDHHWWFTARRRILRDLVAEIGGGRRLRILDVGCGTGGTSGGLSLEHDVSGLDPSAVAVRLAAERFPAARYTQSMDLPAIREAAGVCDLVLLMDVLEHVEDDFLMLSTIAAGLRPGAHLLVTVPAHPDLWSAHDDASQHWRRYTRERLVRVWRDLPLEARLISPCNAVLTPLVRAVRRLRGRGRPWHGTGEELTVPNAPMNAFLRWTFERESGPLVRALREGRAAPYRDGISLLAVLRRAAGPSPVIQKPADVPRDEHDPDAKTARASTRAALDGTRTSVPG